MTQFVVSGGPKAVTIIADMPGGSWTSITMFVSLTPNVFKPCQSFVKGSFPFNEIRGTVVLEDGTYELNHNAMSSGGPFTIGFLTNGGGGVPPTGYILSA